MAPAKQKTQKMSIGTFLADENFGSWADEMDDMPLPCTQDSRAGFGSRPFTTPGFSEHHGGYVREELPLPTQPPYTAHIGNMSFDATQEDISDLFADCEVTSVRVVEDKLTRQPKGFGYVEFASVDGLKKALAFQGTSMKGRNIRVSVAEPPKERHDAREITDWTRKGPLPDLPNQRRAPPERSGFGSRGFDAASDAGSDRGGGGRRGYEPADGKSRDFSNWERKGPLSPAGAPPAPTREGGRPGSKDGPGFRRASPAWGEGRSQDGGSRPPRREFQERPAQQDRTPTAPELDNQWRARMRPDAPPPPAAAAAPASPTASAASPVSEKPAPAVRPKLNLQKRTVAEQTASPTTASSGDSKASPFGAARPIDTAAKEREIEERRETRQKEAEEKAKAEKERIAKEQEEAKEKAAAAAAAPPSQPQSATAASGGSSDTKDGSSEFPQGAKNFEILQRVGESGEDLSGPPSETTAAETAKSPESSSTTTAPRGTAAPAAQQQQHQSKANGNNNWRGAGGNRSRGGSSGGPRNNNNNQGRPPPKNQQQQQSNASNGPPPPAAASPAEPEEEGWSTVSSSKQRSSRRGNSNNRH